jgi:hypothetical protein
MLLGKYDGNNWEQSYIYVLKLVPGGPAALCGNIEVFACAFVCVRVHLSLFSLSLSLSLSVSLSLCVCACDDDKDNDYAYGLLYWC